MQYKTNNKLLKGKIYNTKHIIYIKRVKYTIQTNNKL